VAADGGVSPTVRGLVFRMFPSGSDPAVTAAVAPQGPDVVFGNDAPHAVTLTPARGQGVSGALAFNLDLADSTSDATTLKFELSPFEGAPFVDVAVIGTTRDLRPPTAGATFLFVVDTRKALG